MKAIRKVLQAPLAAAWSEQYVRILVEGLPLDGPFALHVNGGQTPFQYTGRGSSRGAEVLIRTGFARGESKALEFRPAGVCDTDRARESVPLEQPTRIGVKGTELLVANPLAAIGAFPVESRIHCDRPIESRSLTRVNSGPLFVEYALAHRSVDRCGYDLALRCYRHEPIVEIAERFALGTNAYWELALNPQGQFDCVLSHRGPEFEGEPQPVLEPLGTHRPDDVLCRLQMPVLSEYFVPNNRGWFALFDRRHEEHGMLGLLGLYGAEWTHPAQNMMRVAVAGGRAVLRAPLASGTRHWLLYAGPVEKTFTPARRFVFHRLHAEFNALRLDEHLDLAGDAVYDASCWSQPGFFGPDYRERAQRNATALPPLKNTVQQTEYLALRALLDPRPQTRKALEDDLFQRFAKWVRQFQGYREGRHDYEKNVIGFSRRLRGLLIAYELLRKDGALRDDRIRRLHAYFVFAARRILDEGRWPHSKTWLHPDHPESTRAFYAYPGEHQPDRLVWTNCLPNFQSDPMCALLHLSAVIPEHPDAPRWQRFALDDLERQLDAYCGASGAWEESINYANFTLTYFVTTFRMAKHRLGIDYFHDDRLRRFAGWLTRFFGPYDKRFEAYTFPGIGNSVLPQQDSHVLLAYAGQLAEDDPLRHDLIAVYRKTEPTLRVGEDGALLLAAMAPIPDREYPLRPLASEHMTELGVAMRHDHPSPKASYLFQKIGFWKDHYENDETSFNWYAKGTPLVMDYGTYTPDVATAAAHNLVEIPDMDPLRRGYLADHFLSPIMDYTRCEAPVTLKLLWGHVRTFAEVDNKDGKVDRNQTPYHYIGDEPPLGPKVWKTRILLFVKPDYLVIFDRVVGGVPHRFNLHFTGDRIVRDGPRITARGRFDLDLLAFVQSPEEFDFETGEMVPSFNPSGKTDEKRKHRQSFFRLYNRRDGIYRTLLFAQERDRPVRIETAGGCGLKVVTPEYMDYIFLNDEWIEDETGEVRLHGTCGWIRHPSGGGVMACLPHGDRLEGFGVRIEGRGPWTYNLDGSREVQAQGGPPRTLRVAKR